MKIFNSVVFIPLLLGVLSGAASRGHAQGGVPLWTNRYDVGIDDEAWAIAVDSNGSAFVTGSSYAGVGTCCDYVTIKYSSAGVSLWTRRYNGPGNSQDIARAIAV